MPDIAGGPARNRGIRAALSLPRGLYPCRIAQILSDRKRFRVIICVSWRRPKRSPWGSKAPASGGNGLAILFSCVIIVMRCGPVPSARHTHKPEGKSPVRFLVLESKAARSPALQADDHSGFVRQHVHPRRHIIHRHLRVRPDDARPLRPARTYPRRGPAGPSPV